MVQAEWRDLLEVSLKNDANRNWYAWLHLGVMRLEHFDIEGARAAWQISLEFKPSAWAWRNLSVLAQLKVIRNRCWITYPARGDWLRHLALPRGIGTGISESIVCCQNFIQTKEVYECLPPALQNDDRIQILRGRIALELDNLELVGRVMQR